MSNHPDRDAPAFFVLDVDGVMTTGQFLYSTEGKAFKVFGPDDHDALMLLRPYLTIHFITGDRKGYEITKKRIVDDMNFPLDLVSTINRLEWIKNNLVAEKTIYMGDGIFDSYVFPGIAYSICPANGFHLTRERANFVTKSSGGDRAVAEACLHILEKFFVAFDPDNVPDKIIKTGEWAV
ncbi:MAG: phosphatase [Acidobacteriota bacterium]|nr:MAG: phosphatase [Acidobacteriota bacterium]